MVYDHSVEIESLTRERGQPLEEWTIRVEISHWCKENCAQVALSQDKIIWFAYETDAAMFYLRFS